MSQPTLQDNADASAKPQLTAEAGVAGGSGGSLLLYLAQNLSDDHWFKSWLIILAPWATLAITWLWARMRFHVDDYFAQRQAKAYLQRALGELQEGIDDPNTPDEQREEWRHDLAALRRDFINENTAQFRAYLRRWRKK